MEKKKKRKKTKKPKVVLNRKQVVVLAVAIVSVCVCMLCVTILTLPSSSLPEKENIVEQIAAPPLQEPSRPKAREANEKTTVPMEVYSVEKKEDSIQPVASASQKEEVPVSKQEPPRIQEPVQPESPFDIVPTANKNATLVVVLDDGGQNLGQLQHFLDLPFPLDVAVLPGLQYSVEAARRVRSSGKELMLHQPMQAVNLDVNPGPNAITPDMHTYDIESLVRKNIEEIGPVSGLNNHEGSLITELAVKIGAVLDVCSSEEIFFLDSRTSVATKAPQAALERGLHIWERDVFLDNTQAKADIIAQIIQGTRIANRDGYAIMIGHVWSSENLASILLEMYEVLSKKGYRFSTVGGLNENFGD